MTFEPDWLFCAKIGRESILGCRSSGRAFKGTKRCCRSYYDGVRGQWEICKFWIQFNSNECRKLHRRLQRRLTRTKRIRRPGPSFWGPGLVFTVVHRQRSWHCFVYVMVLLRTRRFHNHFDCSRLSSPAPPCRDWVNFYVSRSICLILKQTSP